MKSQRQKFFLQRKNAYLNCAYMSPMLKKVEKAGEKGLKMKRNPAKITVDDFFGEANAVRISYSKLIDNPEPDRIAIIPSASYGLAIVANNLPFNEGEILIVAGQFPSNVYPWMRLQEKGFKLVTVSPNDSEERGQSWNDRILEAINERTRVVAIGHVHWADGTLFHLQAIREKLDAVGGLLVVDGTQSIGALPFSVTQLRPDALICAGYKWLMGPYSLGLAYYGPVFDQGVPIEENWINRAGSDNFSNLVHYTEDYREGAQRYNVGEQSNFILLPMMRAALQQVHRWRPENIQIYTKSLMEQPIEEMKSLGYKVENEAWRANHIVGVRLPENVPLERLQQALKRYRVSVSVRGNFIRVSPHVYNDEMDVRKLLKALKDPIFAT